MRKKRAHAVAVDTVANPNNPHNLYNPNNPTEATFEAPSKSFLALEPAIQENSFLERVDTREGEESGLNTIG